MSTLPGRASWQRRRIRPTSSRCSLRRSGLGCVRGSKGVSSAVSCDPMYRSRQNLRSKRLETQGKTGFRSPNVRSEAALRDLGALDPSQPDGLTPPGGLESSCCFFKVWESPAGMGGFVHSQDSHGASLAVAVTGLAATWLPCPATPAWAKSWCSARAPVHRCRSKMG